MSGNKSKKPAERAQSPVTENPTAAKKARKLQRGGLIHANGSSDATPGRSQTPPKKNGLDE